MITEGYRLSRRNAAATPRSSPGRENRNPVTSLVSVCSRRRPRPAARQVRRWPRRGRMACRCRKAWGCWATGRWIPKAERHVPGRLGPR